MEKAVGMPDEMLATTAGSSFGSGDIPSPASSTLTTILSGFCLTGQVQTALDWFDRLLATGVTSKDLSKLIAEGPSSPTKSRGGYA